MITIENTVEPPLLCAELTKRSLREVFDVDQHQDGVGSIRAV